MIYIMVSRVTRGDIFAMRVANASTNPSSSPSGGYLFM
jgi:hypothetical protein